MTESSNANLSPISRRAFFTNIAKLGLIAVGAGGLVVASRGCVSTTSCYCDYPGSDYSEVCGVYCDYFNTAKTQGQPKADEQPNNASRIAQ